jgi:superfamily II DNA or RNA helicase
LVNKLNHGKTLEKMIPGSIFIHASSKDREGIWDRLHNKEILTLITTLGDEGVDAPSCDATIIASGGKSAIKVFQRLRCMTPFKKDGYEKKVAIVVDFDDPYKFLKAHSKKRLKLYKSEPSFKIVERDVIKGTEKIRDFNHD